MTPAPGESMEPVAWRLPDPLDQEGHVVWDFYDSYAAGSEPLYSSTQLAQAKAEARAEAIEECARVCEGWEGSTPPEPDECPDCWGWHQKDYAHFIRALLPKTGG